MTRRAVLADAAYLVVIAAGILGAPFTRSVAVLRFGLVVGWIVCGGWFVFWRAEQNRRKAAELRLAEDDDCQPCPVCEFDHVQPWLNGHGKI